MQSRRVAVARPSYRYARLLIVALCVSAFGPYVVPVAGLRLEHCLIYGGLLYTLSFKLGFKWGRDAYRLLVLCTINFLWILMVSVPNLSWASPYRFCAVQQRFAGPIALIVVIYSAVVWLNRIEKLKLLRLAGITIIALLGINTGVAILTVYFDTSSFLSHFIAIDEVTIETGSVMSSAATMGRITGIFNQPVENGLAYSIGMLMWVYLATEVTRRGPLIWASLILLVVGGLLAVSKIFLLVGLPTAMIYLIWTAVKSMRPDLHRFIIGLVLCGAAALVWLSTIGESAKWGGLNFLRETFAASNLHDEGVVSVVTAGRFGNGYSGVVGLFTETWMKSPVFGLGAPLADASRSLDNGYLEYFAYGGAVALAFYVSLLVVIGLAAWRGLNTDTKLGRLLIALWWVIVAAGVGGPVFTANRALVPLWVVMIVAFSCVAKEYPGNLLPRPRRDQNRSAVGQVSRGEEVA